MRMDIVGPPGLRRTVTMPYGARSMVVIVGARVVDSEGGIRAVIATAHMQPETVLIDYHTYVMRFL